MLRVDTAPVRVGRRHPAESTLTREDSGPWSPRRSIDSQRIHRRTSYVFPRILVLRDFGILISQRCPSSPASPSRHAANQQRPSSVREGVLTIMISILLTRMEEVFGRKSQKGGGRAALQTAATPRAGRGAPSSGLQMPWNERRGPRLVRTWAPRPSSRSGPLGPRRPVTVLGSRRLPCESRPYPTRRGPIWPL